MPHGTTGVPNVQNATRVADEFAGIISSAGGSADRCVTAPAALRTCDPVRAVANTTTPAATNPRPTDRVSDIGSAKWTTPRITWKTAEMYCSIPSVAKRSCLTEALSKSSGTTVTKPVEASKSRWGEPVVQVVAWPVSPSQANSPNPIGASSESSAVKLTRRLDRELLLDQPVDRPGQRQ